MKTNSMNTNSMAYSVHPLASALNQTLKLLGGNLNWIAQSPNKEQQQQLLNLVTLISPTDFRALDMKTIASLSADEINRFLSDNGFDIKLRRFNPGEFGIASILKILMTWEREGEYCIIKAKDHVSYKGAKLKKQHFDIFVSPEHDQQIICITPKEDFTLFITLMPIRPKDEQTMFEMVTNIARTKTEDHKSKSIASLSFPETEINYQPDISWLCGLSAGENFVSQTVMQTKFLLDKHGARAEAAAAIGVTKGISLKLDIIIKQPFFAWIEKPGVQIPTFVAWCGCDC